MLTVFQTTVWNKWIVKGNYMWAINNNKGKVYNQHYLATVIHPENTPLVDNFCSWEAQQGECLKSKQIS